ncbi:hypothetical protein [Bradyrhizobium sp. WSM1743]|uniref:hypothetical protein n=1 Tax=Bradyrhizobium sp. WSM1743 TaxID=318996 RepID=UPI00047FE560|nr:hypothetical protein [Bradyrhizobium sp. WSM1743]
MATQTSPGAVLKVPQVASFVLVLDRSERAGAHGELRQQQLNAGERFVMAGRAGGFVLLSRTGLMLIQTGPFALEQAGSKT